MVWAFTNWMAVVCCQAAMPVDSFLTLSAPSLVSNAVEFALTGEAGVSYVIEASTNLEDWAAVTTNTSANISRVISLETNAEQTFYRAWREPLPMFMGALVVRSNISLNGNNILVDSYDSGDTNYSSTNGLYDPTKRKAGGDVFGELGFISVGNAQIKGKVYMSPTNGGQLDIGPSGSVGELNWSGPGLQPGWYDQNFRWALPDVTPPYQIGLPLPALVTNVWHLVNGSYFVSGNFSVTSSRTIYVAGDATVYVTGNFSCAGKIVIAPGAKLKLFVGGATTALGQVLATDGHLSFQYYGLPANTAISWTGNDEYTAVIYAPGAVVLLGSGGAADHDFQGACVAQSVTVNGHFNIHFDENLKRVGPMR